MPAFFQKIIAFFIAVLAFFGININHDDIDVEIKGDGYEYSIDYEDRELDIEFPANPTTGYSWSYKIDGDALRLTKEEYDEYDIPFNAAGKGGKKEYEFTAVKPGEVTLEFTYLRDFEADSDRTVFVVKVSVDENLRISVVSFDKVK